MPTEHLTIYDDEIQMYLATSDPDIYTALDLTLIIDSDDNVLYIDVTCTTDFRELKYRDALAVEVVKKGLCFKN